MNLLNISNNKKSLIRINNFEDLKTNRCAWSMNADDDCIDNGIGHKKNSIFVCCSRAPDCQ